MVYHFYRLDSSYTKIEIESWDKQQDDLVGHRVDLLQEHENPDFTAPMEQEPIVGSGDNRNDTDNVVDLGKCSLNQIT